MIGATNINDILDIVKAIEAGKEYESIIDKQPKYIYPKMLQDNKSQWVQVHT